MKRRIVYGILTPLFFIASLLGTQALALTRIIEIAAVGVTDNLGKALASGTITFYDAGTTNLRTVYTDFALGTPASNPATLDSAGRLIVYSNRRLKLLIKNSSGSTVRTIDNVGTADSDISIAASTLAGAGLTAPGDGSLAVNVDNSTLEVSADVLQLKSTITGDRTVTGSITATTTIQSQGDMTVGDAAADVLKIGGSSGPQLSGPSSSLLRGNTSFQVSGSSGPVLTRFDTNGYTLDIGDSTASTFRPAVVSARPSAHGLMIVRGEISSNKTTITRGEGFTSASGGTGIFTISFTTAFTDSPVCTCSVGAGSDFNCFYSAAGVTTTGASLRVASASLGATDDPIMFICVGQR